MDVLHIINTSYYLSVTTGGSDIMVVITYMYSLIIR